MPMAEQKKREIRLRILGVQSLDGQEEENEVLTTGSYFIRDGKHYIFYSEYTEQGRKIRSRLTAGQGFAELKKSDGAGSVLRFQKGKAQNCSYQTAVGTLELISETHRIRWHDLKNGFRLELDYTLYMGGSPVSDYRLTAEGLWQADQTGL